MVKSIPGIPCSIENELDLHVLFWKNLQNYLSEKYQGTEEYMVPVKKSRE